MRALPALVVVLALAASACGDDTAAGCTEVREALDPLSVQHVIDPETATFQTDPPTSGPHLSGPVPEGARTEPLPPAAQVRVLEAGGVVVQYRDPVTEGDVAPLIEELPDTVVVAPGEDLPANVVATAWTWKLTCSSADLVSLREFAATRTGDAPGVD